MPKSIVDPMNWPHRAMCSRRTIVVSSALSIACLVLASTIVLNPISAASANSQTPNQTSNNQTQPSPSTPTKTSSNQQQSKLDTTATKALPQTKGEQQQQQPTDISSMYVQIPIAEPADTGVPDGVQQTLTSTGDSDSPSSPSAALSGTDSSKWTGPWPKKFQIGYIKQSDLHQVLIESLKGDSFASMSGNPKNSAGNSVATAKAASSSAMSSSSLPPSGSSEGKSKTWPTSNDSQQQQTAAGSYGQQPQIPKQMVAQLMPFGKSMYQQQQQQQQHYHQHPQQQLHQLHGQFAQMHNFRDAKLLQPPPVNQFMHTALPRHLQNSAQLIGFQQLRSNHHQAGSSSSRKLPPNLLSMTVGGGNNGFNKQNLYQQPQQQLHFAGFPASFSNQPIYTTATGDQQQPPMLMVTSGQSYGNLGGSVGGNRASKSASSSSNYYGTSWRPVPSEQNSAGEQVKLGSAYQAGDINLANEEMDDDSFNTPTPTTSSGKDAQGGSSMNRHPVLNNYLGDNKQQAMISPAARAKQQLIGGTKGTSGTKSSSSASSPGTKSAASPASASRGSAGTKDSLAGTKTQQNDSADVASMNRRRSQPNATSTENSGQTTSSPTPTSTTTPSTTTLSSIEIESNGTAITTSASITTTQSPSTTTFGTEVEGETQDPESVTISEGGSSEITDPSIDQQQQQTGGNQSTTTTMSSLAPADGQSAPDRDSSASTTQASTSTSTSTSSSSTTSAESPSTNQQPQQQQQDNNDSEVVTQGTAVQQSAGTASLPSVSSSGDDPSASSSSSSSSSTQASSLSRGNSREETTPSSGSDSSSEQSNQRQHLDSTLTDEALLAASARNASDLSKTNSRQPGKTKAKARSSERLVQQQVGGGKKGASLSLSTTTNGLSPSTNGKASPKMAGASANARTAKQTRAAPVAKNGSQTMTATKSASKTSKSASQKQQQIKSSTSSSSPKKTSLKSTRMAANREKSERFQQPAQQLVSMTAAQAQSTAQTLASLLLSRCMSSSNCAHLLDVCSTKQAVVPLVDESGLIEPLLNNNRSLSGSGNSSLAAAWSMPVGLMSTNLNSLTQALQADRVLKTFPQWRDTIESIVDQETQSGYTLILPSNEAMDRLPLATIDQWLSQPELMAQLIDNHIIDSSETIQINGPSSSSSSRQQQPTRLIRSKGLQVNQHRDRMVTINGKRLVYANQAAPGEFLSS